MQRTRLRYPGVTPDPARKLVELRVEFVDVALAPTRDLAIGPYTELLQHPFEDGADTHDELQVVRRPGAEKCRRRIIFEIDDELPIARSLAANGCELRVEASAFVGELAKLLNCRALCNKCAAQRRRLRFEASNNA